MSSISETKKPSRVFIGTDKRLQFRHPIVVDDKGYGYPVKFGVGRLTASERGKFEEKAQELIDRAPRTRDEAGGFLGRVSKKFEPICSTNISRPLKA